MHTPQDRATGRPRSRYNALLEETARSRRGGSSVERHTSEYRQAVRTDRVDGRAGGANRSRVAQRGIQERIKELILDRRLESGAPMPTETDLMADLDIGRNSLREALKALQAVDIIETRHGFGTYVGQCSLEPFADALVFRGRKSMRGDRRELREIVDLRQALEVGLMPQVIDTIDDQTITRLRERLEVLEANAGRGEAGDLADRDFHDEMYAALGNVLIGQLIHVFWDVYDGLTDQLPPVEHDRQNIIQVHRDIFDAVVNRDVAAAAAAMARHFSGIRKRIDS